MANLIVISGDLAAGKSTLAASLSAELNLVHLTKDSLKEIACDAIGYNTREENRQLSIAATDSMIYFFNQSALVGQSLILEANFRQDEMMKIKEIADEYHYQVLLIVLTGDINLLYQRFLDRMVNRHIAHRSLNLDYSIERFASYINDIRNQDLIYPAYTIDMTDLDEDEVTEKALSIIHQELGI
ncbi:MAG: zeta toxin family protein [Bacilli bacterium]|nr:zeta toxin family protein [Bacilli bacterium]